MATRTIIAAKASSTANIMPTGSMKFSVISDTGTVEGASVASASVSLSNATPQGTENNMWLQVRYGAYDADVLGETGILGSYIANQSLPLHSLRNALATDEVSTVVLSLQSETSVGTVLIADGSTVTLEIVCAERCTMSGVPYLSASQSTGTAVVLQWPAGSGAAGNALSYYEVERQLSTNGGYSWGEWEPLTQTANTYAVVQPPATVGYYYRFRVRAVGTAGEDCASSWYASSTLKRIEITRCGTPGGVTLTASESSGSVRMSWTAASNGVENSVSYYEVQRSLSTDGGSTWGAWAPVGTTTNLYMWVEPPETVGHIYKFYIRTVGSAGTDYASYWLECGKTLKKVKAALVAYTDPEILPGITKVKAAHITELQTNINLVRTAANYIAYEFTSIRAGYTNLNAWNAHIAELRTAIDGLGVSHEAWLTLGVNCPRADVLMQLRRVVEAVADD